MDFFLTYWPLVFCGALVLACGVLDVYRGRISDRLTLPAIVAGLLANALQGGVMGSDESIGLFGSVCGFLICFGPMVLLWRIGGIGGGDVKLLAAIGAILGWQGGLDVMFASFIVAAMMACVVMFRRRIARKSIAGAWEIFKTKCVARPGKKTDGPDEGTEAEVADSKEIEGSPKLPFAAAVAVGFVFVVVIRIVSACR